MFENKITPDDMLKCPDNSEISNYVVTIYEKRYILQRYMKVIRNGVYYIFLGIFNDESKVPNVNCLYIDSNGNAIFNNAKRSNVPKASSVRNIPIPEDHLSGDDSLLRLEIRPEDDELMVLMKSLLIKKKITVGQFKRLYGEEFKKDINNDRSRIENKDTLSWNKFKHLLQLLGHKYEVIIYDDQ